MNKPGIYVDGLVTTIIPVFNRPSLLLEAVRSVLDQTYRPIEIVIVDDGSTDDTGRVAEGLATANPREIYVCHIENSGPGLAREAGRQMARGAYLQYLDSDDLLLPGKFEAQVSALAADPGCGIAYGKTLFTKVGESPIRQAYKGTGVRRDFLFPELLMDRWWCTNTPLFRRSLTDKLGPWSQLWNEEDWEYDARAAALGTRLCYCDDFVSVQRSHIAEQHLCYGGGSDPSKLRDRAMAHGLILGHARAAGITNDQPEMRHFSRELFLLSRLCGAAGLATESMNLFTHARASSSPGRAQGWDFRLYGLAVSLLGWKRVGQLATLGDRIRA